MMHPVIQWSYHSLHSKIAPPPLPSASSTFCKCTAKSSNVLFSQDVLEAFLLDKQMNMCDEAALADGSGKQFLLNKWNRGDDPKYGYGITRVIEGGKLFEKAGINVSIVRGYLSETRAKAGVSS
ncbi:hypothetical protein O6H91_Y250100 [Diphasiastrum complanatum]|nr:hypothetical protein O6H91_Y325400 [Diphasiastrum complanatum]KAJ7299328.1 hypothetical protein O6H91_Y250100 [Diphasiastrum complanatum]